MFTTDQRARVRERVLELARADARISGGAITGSAAVEGEDRWSDIDLSFGVIDDVEPEAVLDDWTEKLGGELGVLHHWDLRSGPTIYRVFLLPAASSSTLPSRRRASSERADRSSSSFSARASNAPRRRRPQQAT